MTQLNTNDGDGMRLGDTDKYKSMLLEAWKAEARKQFLQDTSWERPVYPPHKAYLDFLRQQRVARIQTEMLPDSKTRQTDEIDISARKTVIEDWRSFASAAGLPEIACTPLPETKIRETKKLSIPLISPIDPYPRYYISYTSAGKVPRDLIETGIKLFYDERKDHPTLIEVSPDVKKILPLLADWEEGYPGIKNYPPPRRPIKIVGNPHLGPYTVRCWGH